jgi:hypothetical protein
MKLAQAALVVLFIALGTFVVALGFIWLATTPNNAAILSIFAACFSILFLLHARHVELV